MIFLGFAMYRAKIRPGKNFKYRFRNGSKSVQGAISSVFSQILEASELMRIDMFAAARYFLRRIEF
jgi:hypothetical protein